MDVFPLDDDNFQDKPTLSYTFLFVPMTSNGMATVERWIADNKKRGYRISKRWSVRETSGGVVSHSLLVEMVKDEE